MSRIHTVLLCAAALCALGSRGLCDGPAPAREPIEWADIWIAHADKMDRPKVLLIGDSITRGYFPYVDRRLEGKAYVSRLTGSRCVGDPILLEEIRLVLGHDHFDVIHFNNGMHGWDNSDEFYAAHFAEYLALIRRLAGNAKLIWATTTPVREAANLVQLSDRTERVKVRNAAAAKFIAAAGIPTDDLFALVLPHPEYWSARGNGVHYTDQGYAAEGDQVAATVLKVLP